MKALRYSLLCALLSLSTLCYADAYRCKTPQGTTVFQDKPCSNGAKGGEMQIRSLPNGGAAGVSQTPGWKDREEQSIEQRRKKAEAEQQAAKADEPLRNERCATARRNADILRQHGMVYSRNKYGQRDFIDDAERSKAISQAEKQIQEHCD